VTRWIPTAALALLAGCAGSGGPVVLHPVKGKVLYAGKPAAGVRVFFYPTTSPLPPEVPANPHGVTGPDGSFTLTSIVKDDGAMEGGYQVILFWPPDVKEGEEATDQDRLLNWYDAKHSQLTADIKAGPNELPAFDLPAKSKPAGESEGVPGRN
jgi:hypothetical protein